MDIVTILLIKSANVKAYREKYNYCFFIKIEPIKKNILSALKKLSSFFIFTACFKHIFNKYAEASLRVVY